MLKKTIIPAYAIIILLSLNACEDTTISKNNKPKDATIIDMTEQEKKVIDFKKLVQEHGSEEAALDYLMTLDMVILDFYTDWCPPCRNLAPILLRIAKQISSVTFVKINAETFSSISQKFSIRAYPTLLCFRNGTKINTKMRLSESELIADIKKVFNLS